MEADVFLKLSSIYDTSVVHYMMLDVFTNSFRHYQASSEALIEVVAALVPVSMLSSAQTKPEETATRAATVVKIKFHLKVS